MSTITATLNLAIGGSIVVTNVLDLKQDISGKSITLTIDQSVITSLDASPATPPLTVSLLYASGTTVVVTNVLDMKIDDAGHTITLTVDANAVTSLDAVPVA